MKKKIGLVLLCLSILSSSVNVFASDANSKQGDSSFSEWHTEAAIPTNKMQSRAAGIVWGYGLTGTAGWISGHNITATSSAKTNGTLKKIDKMTTKLTFNFTGTATKSDSKSGSASSQSVYMYDGSGNTEIKSYVSKHTFQHTGYVTTTKTISKSPGTI
ncbi:hypothetical protein [uncultured Robinsoniella sp.]|uniref:hypothetical protein n=1 Tax=uncultured Robinsoniella sp. TaxID=904190 RepID=UPI00374EA1B0